MKTHELKTWPEYFEAIIDGRKPFELREDDRDFEVGDRLHLREYDSREPGPNGYSYTGREAWALVTYILRGGEHCGLSIGYVIMGIQRFFGGAE